jgi:hypothetical protein
MAFDLSVPFTDATIFQTPDPVDIRSPASGAGQRNAPLPLFGISMDMSNIPEADALTLSGELAQSRGEEVIVTHNDRTPDMPGGTTLTVQSHTGASLVIAGWPSGRTVPAGKRISKR